jgi:uncharacterized alkaline shock family protein YloU
MDKETAKTSFGIIKIHKKVIASIASISCLETEGVSRLHNRFAFKIFKFLNNKQEDAIEVDIYKNGEIGLNLSIIIKYGYNIPEVAYKVQENIQLALEKFTNMTVRYVNVTVKGVERSKV